MAHHPSAAKRNRQRIVRTARNKAHLSALRTLVRKTGEVIAAGSKDAPKAAAHTAGAIDKSASKGVIPKKRASRLKSRLAKRLHRAAKK